MELQVRYLSENDYDTLCEWWSDNRFPPPPREMLPDNGTGGVMVTKGGLPVCAGFLYLTNSKCAWCEWIVADFHYRQPDRDSAILLVIESLKALAKDAGFKYIYTTVKNKSLISKYEACGFVKGDSNSQEMIAQVR